MFCRAHALAGADGNCQTVFARWIRTVVLRVEVAERMIRAVEIEIVDAGRRPIELEIPAAWIRFGSVCEIAKRNEQVVGVLLGHFDKRGEREETSFQRER